jgi:uncharacterized protein with GYD domain
MGEYGVVIIIEAPNDEIVMSNAQSWVSWKCEKLGAAFTAKGVMKIIKDLA